MQSNEPLIRLACFITVFLVLAALERAVPRRANLLNRRARWPGNIGLSILNQLFLRLVIPLTAVSLAIDNFEHDRGLFPAVGLPPWLELILALLILDLAIYWQHRLYHLLPLLWRFHRMHHADIDLDVSSGLRFHPLSVALSALIKLGVVYLVGPSPLAVLLFEVLLNATSLFNHSNIRIPNRIDRWLRLFVVTPDMHRVHHSARADEQNHNFGFNFPWWDRMFGSYKPQPGETHELMTIGLDRFRSEDSQRLRALLLQPFGRNDAS